MGPTNLGEVSSALPIAQGPPNDATDIDRSSVKIHWKIDTQILLPMLPFPVHGNIWRVDFETSQWIFYRNSAQKQAHHHHQRFPSFLNRMIRFKTIYASFYVTFVHDITATVLLAKKKKAKWIIGAILWTLKLNHPLIFSKQKKKKNYTYHPNEVINQKIKSDRIKKGFQQ